MVSFLLLSCRLCLILTTITLFVGLSGCHNSHQALEKSDLFTDNSQPLPESFVSVSIKRYFVQNVHLAGGLLIHPGVIITDLSQAERLLKDSEKASFKDHLYLTFNLQGASQKAKTLSVKVQKAVALGNKRDEETLSLLFFEPHERLAHIKPMPIATTEDIQHIEDAVGGNLRAVGITATNVSEQARPSCPRNHAKLMQTDFAISSKQFGWSLEIMEAFPGVIEPYLLSHVAQKTMDLPLDELKKKMQDGLTMFPEVESMDLRKERTHYYYAAMCSMAGFCTEFTSSPNPAFQCIQHLGYPVLWQSPSGIWKALGISHNSWYSVGGDLSVLAHVITPDIMSHSIHIDLVQFHNDIKFQLASATKQKDFPFKLDHQVIQRLDHSTEQALKNNQHLDFLAGLASEHSPGVYHTSCLGALIGKGVMITAGHCLIETDPSKSYVTLKDGHQDYLVQAQKFLVEPSYKAAYFARKPSDTFQQIFSADQADIGLVFFEQPEDFSPVTKVRLPTAQESDEALKKLRGDSVAELLAPTSHQLRANQIRKKFPYVFKDYRWLKNRTIRNVNDHLERSIKLYFADVQQKEQLITLVESITKEQVDKQNFMSKMASAWQSKPIMTKYVVNIGELCKSGARLCTWVHDAAHHIEQTTGSCFGDSGAPTVWRAHRTSGEFLLLGVFSTSFEIYDQSSPGCGGQKLNTRVSSYRDWILDSIDRERSQ